MPKLSVYLDKDRERKLKEIKETILSEIKAPKVNINIDLTRSKLISLAIDKLHEVIVGKAKKEG